MSPTYELYGLQVRSEMPLPAPTLSNGVAADAEIVRGGAACFAPVHERLDAAAAASWFHHRALPDGARYLRWTGLFEFLVAPDGRRIVARRLGGSATAPRAFETYLLGQVLSFVLLARGLEPLHSTAVVVPAGVVGFLGDCGHGKSTLGAAFLRAGRPLLTDDLLVVRPNGHGFVAYPGPPRIKLFPHVASAVLGDGFAGTPMNDQAPKLVIPLRGEKRAWRGAAPLRAIYVLRAGPARRGIAIRRLSPRRAFVELTRNTFNTLVVDAARLARQFDLAARLAAGIPVKTLAYPRALPRLAAVRDAVLADLRRSAA